MLKILAILFGLSMIAIGILGFLPDYTPQGLLLGVFLLNPVHNLFHLVTGFIALICGLTSGIASKIFFILFGLVFTAVAVLGFMQGEGNLFNVMAINQADNFLNAGFAAFSLFVGLFLDSKS